MAAGSWALINETLNNSTIAVASAEAGTEYVFGILRDGETMELRLTLRELL